MEAKLDLKQLEQRLLFKIDRLTVVIQEHLKNLDEVQETIQLREANDINEAALLLPPKASKRIRTMENSNTFRFREDGVSRLLPTEPADHWDLYKPTPKIKNEEWQYIIDTLI